MANVFDYLTVLISIVLGLGIAHLLGGIARSVSRRSTTLFYWPTLVWAFVLLIIIVQVWWVDFSLSRQTQWTLPGFASTLLIPATLYFMAFLILPESSDMREAYFENRVWFFSLLIAVPLFGSLQQILVEGHVHKDIDTLAKVVGLALTVSAICFRSERAQKVFAVVGIVFVVLYVWGLFFHLPPPA
ncbi:MAG TPA: hypothetical protein VII69_13725 [Candidatus Eremiobacteraceae bacterium]